MKTQFSAVAISAIIITTGFSPAPLDNSANTKQVVKAGYSLAHVFTSFSSHRQGKGITLNWDVEATAGVTTFTIQRTYEDVNDPYSVWEDISSSPADGSKFYRYTDENVSPGLISYRVIAFLTDGTTEDSGILTEQIIVH